MNLRPPKNHERLLRHRAKMQRKWQEGYDNSESMWLKPSGEWNGQPCMEPKNMDLLYLWARSQIDHDAYSEALVKFLEPPTVDKARLVELFTSFIPTP